MNYKIVDNYLDKNSFELIKNSIVKNNEFPWYYNDKVSYKNEKDQESFQFTHVFYNYHLPQSNFINIVNPVLEKLEAKALIRIKANLITKTEKIKIYENHIDFDFPCKTAVFYLNTNNGFTIFENGEKIESIENRMLFFDSHNIHAGSSCTDQKTRIVLNINYF
jgi:hypothetical protein